ncbi:MAG: ABC transporter substrate-binding protein [Planctomycetes bacterium]|nr:ABC transporter substrate-binding protein [Planctomycetota bacterium]
MRNRIIAAVVLILAVAIGCAQKGGADKPGEKKLTIAVIPKGTSHVFWQSVHAGAAKAGKELAVKILWDGPATEGERAEQIRIVEDMITRQVDGIVLAPLDDKALVPVIERAQREGILLTIFDSAADTDKYVSFVATDNYRGGVEGAEAMAKILGEKGKIAVVKYSAGSASTTKRENGFIDTIKKKYPNIKIADAQFAGTTVSKATDVAEDILTKNPDLDGIFACNESTAVGTVQAIKARKLTGKIKMVGFDCSPQLQEALKTKVLDALVVQNPFKMGYEGVKTLVDLKNGKTPEKRIDTGVTVVTRDNLDTPEIQALVNPDLDKWLK